MMDRHHDNIYVGQEVGGSVPELLAGLEERGRVLLGAYEGREAEVEGAGVEGRSVYSGRGGVALLYWRLFSLRLGPDQGQHYLRRGLRLVENDMKRLRGRSVAFLGGDAGPLTLGILLSHHAGKSDVRKDFLRRLLKLGEAVLDVSAATSPNEVLYGRAGYLYALLFINQELPGVVEEAFLRKVVDVLVGEGLRAGRPRLYYEWHGKCYLGAAHGILGIIYLLLKAHSLLSAEQGEYVKKTADWLLGQQSPGGNFPSSFGKNEDRLVQWCHGAPGAIYALLEAHRVYGEEKFLKGAVECAEVVWKRGLLRKGYSLCHGVSGNAYALMAIHKYTQEEKYLRRALVLAKWCADQTEAPAHPPDTPLSLFEGQAGVVYMINDFAHNAHPAFPAFQLN